jgi:hypothetical protein
MLTLTDRKALPQAGRGLCGGAAHGPAADAYLFRTR